MTIDDTATTAAKGKAVLSDTQEIPAGSVTVPIPADSDDEEDDALAARELDARSRRKARRITGVLALIAALGIGFFGGVLYQKNEGSSSSNTSASGIASALRAAFGGRGGTGGTGGGAGGATGAAGRFGGLAGGGTGSSTAVVGTVSAVADGTLYISQGSSSALVKVVTNPQSSVTTSQTAPLSAVQPGDTVVISGAKQKNGSFMASSIRDSGASSTTGGGGGGAASLFGG